MDKNMNEIRYLDKKFYNYITTFQKNNFIIKLSIDFVTLSVFTSSPSSLTLLLNKLYELSYDKNYYKSGKNKKQSEASEYSIKYNSKDYKIEIRKSYEKYKPYLLKIHDPDTDILLFINNYLKNKLNYHINEVEFTFNWVFDDNKRIYKFLKKHLYIKWQGQEFNPLYEDTEYFGNPRKSRSKGGRAYFKEIKDYGDSVRFEIVYKRELIKKRNYNVKTIEDLIGMDIELILKNIDFKRINYLKVNKRLKIENYSDAQIEDIMTCIRDVEETRGCREANKLALQCSKRYDNDTYLIKHPFADLFYYELKQLSFLGTNNSCVNLVSSISIQDKYS